MSERDTYPAPPDGWVCFHCGERYTTPNAARDHFGFYPKSTPICAIEPARFQAELREYRVLEARFLRHVEQNDEFWQNVSERMRALLHSGQIGEGHGDGND